MLQIVVENNHDVSKLSSEDSYNSIKLIHKGQVIFEVKDRVGVIGEYNLKEDCEWIQQWFDRAVEYCKEHPQNSKWIQLIDKTCYEDAEHRIAYQEYRKRDVKAIPLELVKEMVIKNDKMLMEKWREKYGVSEGS